VQRGFLYAHLGWIFVPRNDATDYAAVRDLARYKELMWLDRHPYLPAGLLASAAWLIAGWPGQAIGLCWSTVAVWDATFCVNSLGHVVGQQRYVTGDLEKQLAGRNADDGRRLAQQPSCLSGIGATGFSLVGIRSNLLRTARAVVAWHCLGPAPSATGGNQGRAQVGRLVIDKVAGQLAASFPINQIANAVHDALAHAPSWGDLKVRIASARSQADTFWSGVDLPEVPSLEEVRRFARERLAQTPSLEDIAVRARERLLELIYLRLSEAAQLS
jgi:stearoyl-CoA desaturase (delta-9 desaturase)